MPSRLDIANERYGGPFTTEKVGDVKTFLQILILLSSTGLIFPLEVPASYFTFPLFGFHTLHYNRHILYQSREFCTREQTVVGDSALMYTLSTLIVYPMYMYFTFSMLRKKVQKLIARILIGSVNSLPFVGVACLLSIDLVGHSLKHTVTAISNHSQCMFQVYTKMNGTLQYPALDMH